MVGMLQLKFEQLLCVQQVIDICEVTLVEPVTRSARCSDGISNLRHFPIVDAMLLTNDRNTLRIVTDKQKVLCGDSVAFNRRT